MPRNHDHHTYDDFLKTQTIWNGANKAARQRMLADANENKNLHYPRAFAYIPAHVRDKLIESYMYSKQLKTPAPKLRMVANNARF